MMKKIRNTLICLFALNVSSCYSQVKLSTFDRIVKDNSGQAYLKSHFENNALKSQSWLMKNDEVQLVFNPDTPASVKIEKDKVAWKQFIQDHLRWPSKDIEGNVYVALLIDDKGTVVDMRVVKSIELCKECDSYAISFIKQLPKFTPAKFKRKNVLSVKYMVIPFQTP